MNKAEILQIAKPILFNTDMVRAILDGRKTVTRRVMKPQPIHEDGFWKLGGAGWSDNIRVIHPVPCHSLYNRMSYKPGDILYVRETWQHCYEIDGNDQIIEGTGKYVYAASPENVPEFTEWVRDDGTHTDAMPWRPSIHMPRAAARIFLRVTDVRVEKLRDMAYNDFLKEGIIVETKGVGVQDIAEMKYKKLWNSTIKKSDLDCYGWNANPWVWVIEFERAEI